MHGRGVRQRALDLVTVNDKMRIQGSVNIHVLESRVPTVMAAVIVPCGLRRQSIPQNRNHVNIGSSQAGRVCAV